MKPFFAPGRKRLPSQGGTDSDDSQAGVQVTPSKQPAPRGPPPPPAAPDRPSTTPTSGKNVQSTSGGAGQSLGPVAPPSTDPMSATAVRTPILAPVILQFALVCKMLPSHVIT